MKGVCRTCGKEYKGQQKTICGPCFKKARIAHGIVDKPRKVGRPFLPKGQAKSYTLHTRVTKEETQQIKAAAKKANQTISKWLRERILT